MATESPTKSDQLVSQPTADLVFNSRRSELRLTKKKELPVRNAAGDTVDMVPGERVVFKGGFLRIPPGKTYKGENGIKLDRAETVEWLEDHHLFNDREEGFWKLDEPAPQPSEDEINALQDLALDLDLEGLKTFIAQEEAGWKRKSLLNSAQRSLQSATEKIAEMQQKQAEAETKANEKAAKAKPAEK